MNEGARWWWQDGGSGHASGKGLLLGMVDNFVLSLHPSKHLGDGHPFAQSDVRLVLKVSDGPKCGALAHHLVHFDVVLV